MAIMITVTEKTSGKKVHITNGMITDLRRNSDDTAILTLGKEDITFYTVEPFDWILVTYGKLT